MKKSLFMLLALLALGCVAFAEQPKDESVCPANRAAEAGHNPFAAFHEVMAPAWHNAWPKKDYDALIVAAPKFTELMAPIMALKPELNETRLASFVAYRDDFAKVVRAYAEAAEKGDKDAVYAMMPDVHEKFEQAASALLPVHYPLVESLAMQVRLITETQLPGKNKEGIVESTDKLATQAKYLDADTIPEELTGKKEAIMANFAELQKIAVLMKECCDKDDMDGLRTNAEAFDGKIKAFIKEYL